MAQNRYRRKERVEIKKFDLSNVIKYFIFSAIFVAIVVSINKVVMTALSTSPTGRAGNGMLNLYEVHNSGAAFNMFQNNPEAIISASVLSIIVVVLVVLFKSAKLEHGIISSLAMLTSGILVNTYERILNGYVIDYIECAFAPLLPVFNTADILIVFGALGVVMALLTKKQVEKW